MRLFAIAIAIVLFALGVLPAQAQTTFTQGYYEFENVVGDMTTSGTWGITNIGSIQVATRSTASVGGNITFLASGKTLVIWRYIVANTISSRMDVCIGASCTGVHSESTAPSGFLYPLVFTLPPGTNTVVITRTLGTIYLDSFMILQDPATGGFPTPVPTATIIPSPTPASTTTPQPTPTPQPSSTPISVIWAIDPQKSYSSINGHITAFDYSASAADIHLANLLTLLVISVWGFFFFTVFVLVKYKVGKK